MTDEGTEQPTAPDGVPQVQHTTPLPMPGVPGGGIPLPPVGGSLSETPPPSNAPLSPTTPPPPGPPPIAPAGLPPIPPAGLPYGSYALGALAGNPQLGTPSGPGQGAPPTNPGPYGWAPPPPPPHPGQRRGGPPRAGGSRHRSGRSGRTGGRSRDRSCGLDEESDCELVEPRLAFTGAVGRFGLVGRFGIVGRFGLVGRFGIVGGSGSSGGSGGPSDVSAIAKKVDPGLVDIDTTLGYQQEEAAGTGIVLTSTGEVVTNNHVIDGAHDHQRHRCR